jgi:hypothetical protein
MKIKIQWNMLFIWLICIPVISFLFWHGIYRLITWII